MNEHKIECPEIPAIKYFLWYDFFHDSRVKGIAFDQMKANATITLEQAPFWIWHKLKGSDEEKNDYFRTHADEYTYLLRFKNVEHFHVNRLPFFGEPDYIEGRFLDTALLRKLMQTTGKHLYQLRIRLDDGFCDIIFETLTLRRKKGRVTYPRRWFSQNALKVRDIYDSGNGADNEEYRLMKQLFSGNPSGVLELARKNISLGKEMETTRWFSAYVLGKLGNGSDMDSLMHLYLEQDAGTAYTLLPRQMILDAMESIRQREYETSLSRSVNL